MKRLRKREPVRNSGLPEGWPPGLDPIALASQQCVFCRGRGFYVSQGGDKKVCKCVHRQIFRQCLERYKQIQSHMRSQQMHVWAGRNGIHFSFPDAEYCADFVSVSARNLTDCERAILETHFIEGKDWVASLPIVRMVDPHILKSTFYHRVYETMRKAGESLVTCQPHRLYPLDEYFSDRPSVSLSSVVRRWMCKTRRYAYPVAFWKPDPLDLPEPYASRPAIPTPKSKE